MNRGKDGHRSGLNTEVYHSLTGFSGDWRDTWWDDDFLSLMAEKWRLTQFRHALDVGCGVGHWGQRLMAHMHPDATLVGCDAESRWVEEARVRAQALGLGERSSFEAADAKTLPWDDDTFDLVTCQTLLIHVAHAPSVIEEMLRVLRPGGLFLCAEPNNFASLAGGLSIEPKLDWTELAPLLKLDYICARGKEALGEGFQSEGAKIPAHLYACGWRDVHVHMNNKGPTMLPPYDAPNMMGMVDMMRTAHASGGVMSTGGTYENVRRLFLAGGGQDDELEALWAARRARDANIIAAIDEGRFISAGASIHYLVWGYKPD